MLYSVKHSTKPILSILICHIPERLNTLVRLLEILISQSEDKRIEIVVEDTPKNVITIGGKRNLLLKKAKGKYIVFVDDDDTVSIDYIDLILAATRGDPDCVGITGMYYRGGVDPWKFIHSLGVKKWYKNKSQKTYYRCPNHLNPVKKSYAIQTGFKNISFGEDKDYSLRINKLLKTEAMITKPIYNYIYTK